MVTCPVATTLLYHRAGSAFDAGAKLKALTALAGGKGGGRPERAEGRLPAGADLPALLARLS